MAAEADTRCHLVVEASGEPEHHPVAEAVRRAALEAAGTLRAEAEVMPQHRAAVVAIAPAEAAVTAVVADVTATNTLNSCRQDTPPERAAFFLF